MTKNFLLYVTIYQDMIHTCRNDVHQPIYIVSIQMGDLILGCIIGKSIMKNVESVAMRETYRIARTT